MIARGAEDKSQKTEGRCSMLDSGCLILEKSFTTKNAEDADFAEKATKSTDFEGGAKTDKYMQNKIGGFCPPISEV